MTINITIAFQILHFLIAYVILDRLFFKVAIATVQKRDLALRNVQESLAQQKQNVETLRWHVNDEWQRYQRALRSDVPHPAKQLAKAAIQPALIETKIPSKTEEDALVGQLKTLLVNQALHKIS